MAWLFFLNKIIYNLAGVLLGIMTSIVILQIIARNFFEISVTSSEELARFLMIWVIMLAATVVIRNKKHLAVTYFVELLSPRKQKVLRFFVFACVLIFSTILVFYGFELAKHSMKQIAPASSIPLGYIVASLPISGLISILYTIEHIHDETSQKGVIN
ncbi:hypothetical protein CHH78_20860 [Shouchella clausii]|uniref:Tripartite ATP-independent periplasmic transporters DctQ component domain-containing protein n=1 Tax=Shouchella clausii TaxID=79880 RepID=A0A268RZV3_SHOCL|nr:TRAP transporter small permease [Shouchella clausii]PAD41704.1 hypothetical protein CHH54_16060 [Bacillus sp. 7520-S]MBU8598697.1 TRAP transporter small permease [Shouchella clausii]MCY1106517.1 TRAP transporter small permease [Shouchella clausii]PAD07255.1 hypothetical protein CHH76_20820 [Shouchella clausii]PAE78451.1 hypothetical protein CHH78_20860 [Shouchella clausii]